MSGRPYTSGSKVGSGSGIQRRVISVGRSLASFALEVAAAMDDGAVESVLYLPTNVVGLVT